MGGFGQGVQGSRSPPPPPMKGALGLGDLRNFSGYPSGQSQWTGRSVVAAKWYQSHYCGQALRDHRGQRLSSLVSVGKGSGSVWRCGR